MYQRSTRDIPRRYTIWYNQKSTNPLSYFICLTLVNLLSISLLLILTNLMFFSSIYPHPLKEVTVPSHFYFQSYPRCNEITSFRTRPHNGQFYPNSDSVLSHQSFSAVHEGLRVGDTVSVVFPRHFLCRGVNICSDTCDPKNRTQTWTPVEVVTCFNVEVRSVSQPVKSFDKIKE